jgi:hypothetical protein
MKRQLTSLKTPTLKPQSIESRGCTFTLGTQRVTLTSFSRRVSLRSFPRRVSLASFPRRVSLASFPRSWSSWSLCWRWCFTSGGHEYARNLLSTLASATLFVLPLEPWFLGHPVFRSAVLLHIKPILSLPLNPDTQSKGTDCRSERLTVR